MAASIPRDERPASRGARAEGAAGVPSDELNLHKVTENSFTARAVGRTSRACSAIFLSRDSSFGPMESTTWVDPRHDARIFHTNSARLRLGGIVQLDPRRRPRGAEETGPTTGNDGPRPSRRSRRGSAEAGGERAPGAGPSASPRPRVRPTPDPPPRRTPLWFPSRANQTKCSYDLPVSHLPRRAGGWRAPLRRDDGGTRGHGLARPRARGPHVGGAPRNPRTRPRTPDRPARTIREKPSHRPSCADGRSNTHPVRRARSPSDRVGLPPVVF